MKAEIKKHEAQIQLFFFFLQTGHCAHFIGVFHSNGNFLKKWSVLYTMLGPFSMKETLLEKVKKYHTDDDNHQMMAKE